MKDITELVKMAANGDRAAFDSLYELTKKGVWFTCISLLKNEENAKDIMQDTYLAALEKLGTLENPAAVQAWLNKIAANKCKNYITSKSNSVLENNTEDISENIPDDRFIPEDYVMDAEKRRIIMDIIEDALSANQYTTIILYYFDEMTVSEIAELMNCHEKTVQYRLKTARLKIKEEIERYEKDNRDKLHAVVPFLLLTQLFRAQAESVCVPSIPSLPADPSVSSDALDVPSDSAAAAVKTGGKTMLNSLKAKIIAGACAAVVVGGGVTAAVLISNNLNKKPTVSATSTPNFFASSIASKPAESSRVQSASTPSDTSSEPTEFPENPISPTGEVQWELIPTASADDFEYRQRTLFDKPVEGEIHIKKYIGNAEFVKIPEKIDGKKVTVVEGFLVKQNLKGVYFPDGVTDIEYGCFSHCDNLQYVRFPETLEKLQQNAFLDCNSLESVTLPQTTEILMSRAFESCQNLKSVTVPDTIETMWSTPVYKCDQCELHYRGTVYKGDELDGFELFEGKLTVNGETTSVE